jgi:type II restriction/modification system DNA methylase subunit YeeA
MPFLFERIDDDSELLLPDNLLRSDSVIAKLVAEIPEEDWAEVEIIGWLYQFYISEKKDQVIGKVVKSEDIPAATQLFTPNWIVQYLVQNSVGRLWLMANPQSTLAKEWPYFIAPAEQTPEVQAQLDALIQTRVREDGDTLNPESITVLDPACGSGHILVVAYDVLKAIYLERGYQPRAIPRLILEKNLYGLDIDDRAAQMASFALLMKARADDRRLFTASDEGGNLHPPKLNVLSLQESKGLSVDELATHLAPFKVQRATIAALVETFEHAKTFGSLIQIPYALKTHLASVPEALALVKQSGDMYATAAADDLLSLVQQAHVLAMQFDAVVANPPYMGLGGMNELLTSFVNREYYSFAADLCTAFMARAFDWLSVVGMSAQVNLQKWMFQSSFSEMRNELLRRHNIDSLIQIGFNSFPSMNSKIALGCAFVIRRNLIPSFMGRYVDLNSAPRSADKGAVFRARDPGLDHVICQSSFLGIPDSPIAYWGRYDAVFVGNPLGASMISGGRCKTHSDDLYVRLHWEVSAQGFSENGKWRVYEKGGDFRKWYGNRLFIVNWSESARSAYASKGGLTQERFWNRIGITWSDIALQSGFRLKLRDTEYSSVSPTIFPKDGTDPDLRQLLLLNSSLVKWIMKALNPGIHANPGDVLKVPQIILGEQSAAKRAVELAKIDWDSFEISREFAASPLLNSDVRHAKLRVSFESLMQQRSAAVVELKAIEEESSANYIRHLGLESEVSAEVPLAEVSLTCNPAYRYGDSLRAEEQRTRVLQDAMAELISYAIGCMMGRYSLDEPGLIYAHAGNVGFEPSRYATFPADADGIVPITDELWFSDDAPSRIREFLRAVWGPDTLEENMAWLAESLGTKATETPEETIRRYIADKFFKDHLQTYKKRPIYWLFSSGKQGAFQALVYLHRYFDGTLARLRAEYVVPLTGKIQSRIEMLQKDAAAASSTAARNKLAKDVEKLKKKHAELLAYDEQLRHYADMRITLDLDDGVKVNYGKFGDLLAEVKAITGGASDE